VSGVTADDRADRPLAPPRLPETPCRRMGIGPPDVSEAVATAGLLGDRVRAGILALLRDGPHCVCELAAALGERENNVSNHLARLRRAGLVRASRHAADSRWVYYERDETAIERAAGTLAIVLR
jgi:DNA-binding transcriptional ArsR family regulator